MPFADMTLGVPPPKKIETYFPLPELFGRKLQVPDNRLNVFLFREGAVFYFMGVEITVGALPDTPGQVDIQR